MKAVVIENPGTMKLKEVPIPEPPAGFARVKVKACGICATDLEIIDGNIPANYPLIPGHEWSGIVDAVGDTNDDEWIGKRVIGSNDVVCLRCDACRSGNWRYCKDFEEIGFKRNGAYAEYVIVPVYGLCELSVNVPFEEATLCEPLGVALGCLERSGAKLGDTCLIMGAGSIGLSILSVAKAMGLTDIVVCASSERRLGLAKELGASHTIATGKEDVLSEMRRLRPEGTDVVIDAVGIEECIQKCLKLTKIGGTVVLAGYGRGKEMQLRTDDIHMYNLRVLGAGKIWNQHKKAAKLMANGMISLKRFVTNVIPLEDFEKGIAMTRSRPEGFVKAVFRFD